MATRRGIPCSPKMYWGMKVIQNPTNNNQKCHLPNLSFSMRPIILGYQK